MKKDKLGVGVIGLGLIGKRRAEIAANFPQTKLIAVYDIDTSLTSEVAKKLNCQAAKNIKEVIKNKDVQIIIVATTPNFLYPTSVEAAKFGKHVLVEKPCGRNLTEVERIAKAATKYKVIIKAGYNHRFHPAIRKAYDLCQKGEIGKLMYIRARYGHGGRPGYDKEWRANKNISGGGELIDQGSHLIDLACWFLGDFVKVQGIIKSFFWPMQVEDNAFALLETSDGKLAQIHASWTQWKNLFSFEIFGEDGYLIIQGLGGSYGGESLTLGKRSPKSGPPEEKVFDFPNLDLSWQEEWKEFIHAIEKNKKPLGDIYDACKVMKVADKLYSIKSILI
ncbi:hypothetical protein A2Z23_01730 [Candidatus Curtissbacteria bacterium RBG_16_39_7]|uniref:LmbZ n=1 Tax=Candidatus Curtissbacteria bacterium RBG_16_39_7 TaxID=1797707 RepID=A0A1F5G532_9BACT|nr:MAG: hypothetical protein A2Z23_01730 [Candidatus Curtissbacteria bacterium RBG_16_39_7]